MSKKQRRKAKTLTEEKNNDKTNNFISHLQ